MYIYIYIHNSIHAYSIHTYNVYIQACAELAGTPCRQIKNCIVSNQNTLRGYSRADYPAAPPRRGGASLRTATPDFRGLDPNQNIWSSCGPKMSSLAAPIAE